MSNGVKAWQGGQNDAEKYKQVTLFVFNGETSKSPFLPKNVYPKENSFDSFFCSIFYTCFKLVTPFCFY